MEENGLILKISKIFNTEYLKKALFLAAAIIIIIILKNTSEKKISFCAINSLLKNASTRRLYVGPEFNEG